MYILKVFLLFLLKNRLDRGLVMTVLGMNKALWKRMT